MATRIGGRLTYCGRVGTGFDEATLTGLHLELEERKRVTPPVEGVVPAREAKQAHWVEPELVAEVEFAEWTADRMLRHGRFVGSARTRPRKPWSWSCRNPWKTSRPLMLPTDKRRPTLPCPRSALPTRTACCTPRLG